MIRMYYFDRKMIFFSTLFCVKFLALHYSNWRKGLAGNLVVAAVPIEIVL